MNVNPFAAQHEAIRQEFGRQSASWGRDSIDDDLRWAVGKLALPRDAEVLDVAAGTGLLARALAPGVKSVVAVDITPEMLANGRECARRDGIGNVRFEEGAAEAMPFGDGSFDAVVTRFSFHHFQDADAVAREMARVCRRGGLVGVIDIVAPEDGALAERYNRLERLRDTSHTWALSPSDLRRRIEGAGVQVAGEFRRDVANDLEEWLDRTRTPRAAREEIVGAIRSELDGGALTGMRPFENRGRLAFRHDWSVVVGTRI